LRGRSDDRIGTRQVEGVVDGVGRVGEQLAE